MKLLSIIVAAFNVEKCLDRALLSCYIPNNSNYEVIIVNDGSKDLTEEIAKRYSNINPDIFKIVNKSNGGYGSAINEGIQEAQGKYIKLMDGDDWYNKTELEKLLKVLAEYDADMILTDFTTINEITEEKVASTKIDINPYQYFSKEELINTENVLLMHRICYKREFFTANHINLTEHCFYTDTEYVIYPMVYVQKVLYAPLDVYQYRIGNSEQSMSREGMRKHIDDLWVVYNNINNYIDCTCIDSEMISPVIEWRVAMFYKFYIRQLMLIADKNGKMKLIEVLRDISNRFPKRYELAKNRKIVFMKNTRCTFYKLVSYLVERGL